MSQITLYHFEGCPGCQTAKQWLKELTSEHPELSKAKVELVDVHKTPGFKAPEPFYYVPTFFKDGKKVMEGEVTKESLEGLLRSAIS